MDTKTKLIGIFAIIMLVIGLTEPVFSQPANAISRFENCMTRIANKTHALTFDDVKTCFNSQFHSQSPLN